MAKNRFQRKMMRQLFARRYSIGQNLLKSEMVTLRSTDGTKHSMTSLFDKKKVVVVGIVGAFTSVCQTKHLPTYLEDYNKLRKSGVDEIYCVSVNDHLVMKNFAEQVDPSKKIKFFADPDAFFTYLVGLDLDLSAAGLGVRSQRYSMIVDRGVIHYENVEPKAGEVTVSDAQTLESQLSMTRQQVFEERLIALAEADEFEHCLRQANTMQQEGWPLTASCYASLIEASMRRGESERAAEYQRRLLALPADQRDAASVKLAEQWMQYTPSAAAATKK